MGIGESTGSGTGAMKYLDSSLRSLKSEEVSARHKRSKSFPHKEGEEGGSLEAFEHLKDMEKVKAHISIDEKQSSTATAQSSLKKEILHLEKRLQEQFVVRSSLEKALGFNSTPHCISVEKSSPKPTEELIKEITVLELEVMHLEQHLLTLYRKAFDQQLSSYSPSTIDERNMAPSIEATGLGNRFRRKETFVHSSRMLFPRTPGASSNKESDNFGTIDDSNDRSVQRSHSSLSHRSVRPSKTSPPAEKLDNALRSCHSQPLSFLLYMQNESTSMISLAEHFGTRISDHVPETPNRLSEDVIRSMAAIYCKLAEPPLVHHGLYCSPTSSLSSTSAFSPHDHRDMWSPSFKKLSSFGSRLRSFHDEGSRDFSGTYSSFVEVPKICRDTHRLHEVQDMLKTFKAHVQRLEKVDPRTMKHEEKLAFWINIHNALVMHAYLVYGTSQNTLRRGSLFYKAAYNVGGQILSADAIQTSILGCQTNRPGQWLRTFFFPKMKLRGDHGRKSYAIEHPEPLLHFALCTGSHSDPGVRVYTAKGVIQELEAAKEEYIRETVSVQKDHKLCLPRVIESFAKDSGLSPASVVGMVQHHLPIALRKATQKRQKEKPRRCVEWVPHNHSFRYLLSKELLK